MPLQMPTPAAGVKPHRPANDPVHPVPTVLLKAKWRRQAPKDGQLRPKKKARSGERALKYVG